MMKNFAILVLATTMSGQLYAQGENQTDAQGRKHGLWKKHYPNGQLRYQGRFEHGREVDTFRFYFEEGGLKAENYFRPDGSVYSRQFGDGEQLAAEGVYRNQKRDSTWTFYDAEGNLLSSEEYQDDQRHGTSVTYFDDGRKAQVQEYREDEKHGEWKMFYDNGKPRARGQYLNGKLHGEVKYFHTNGKLSAKGQYRKGLMHGSWYYFDEAQKLDRKEEWRYGILQKDDAEEETEGDDEE